MKVQIEKSDQAFARGGIDDVAKIWLDTNMEAHSFVPAEYWEGNLALVKEMFLQAEMYVYSETEKSWVLLGWIKAILQGFLCGKGRSPGDWEGAS